MKIILATILSLGVISSYASDNVVANITANSDGSKTFEKPHLKLGQSILRLSPTSPNEGVCKFLGFDSYMEKSRENVRSIKRDPRNNAPQVIEAFSIDSDGKIVGRSDSFQVIEAITCYNSEDLKQVVAAEKIVENFDGSYFIKNPSRLIGNKKLNFFAFGSKAMSAYANERFHPSEVCEYFGFESELEFTDEIDPWGDTYYFVGLSCIPRSNTGLPDIAADKVLVNCKHKQKIDDSVFEGIELGCL